MESLRASGIFIIFKSQILARLWYMKNYKLVIFDFDKTLYDGRFFAMHLIIQNLPHILRVRAERNVRHSLAGKDFENAENLRREEVCRLALLSDIEYDVADKWYTSYMQSMPVVLRKHYKARPRAWEVVESLLDAGVSVGVLSDYPATSDRMRSIGLTDERIYHWSAEEFGALKPAPRPFLEAAKQVGVSPDEALVVGDRADTDGAGAKAAGMDSLLIKGKRATGQDGFEALQWDDVADRLISIAKGASK